MAVDGGRWRQITADGMVADDCRQMEADSDRCMAADVWRQMAVDGGRWRQMAWWHYYYYCDPRMGGQWR